MGFIGIAVGVAAAASIAGTALSATQKGPKIPGLPDSTTAPGAAASANLAAFPTISALADKTNAYNQKNLDARLEDIYPGYKDALKSTGNAITDWTGGKLSDDAVAELYRTGAAQAVTGGYGGAPRANFNNARNILQTSTDLQKTGIGALQSWLQTAKGTLTAPQFDVSSMFLTPGQKIAGDENQFQRQLAQNQVDAYNEASTARLLTGIGSSLSSATGTYIAAQKLTQPTTGAGSNPFTAPAGGTNPAYDPNWNINYGVPASAPSYLPGGNGFDNYAGGWGGA